MNTLLPLALTYLARGYSVIPVGADKRPLVSWKEFQTRRATADELVAWWTQSPDAQVGIVTGEISNLTVVDVESDGDFNLVKDITFEVETGGKGKHYYFQYEPDFKNAVRILPSVDIRSEGGYVVASGSKTSKGAYTTLRDIPVMKMTVQTKETLLGASKARFGGVLLPASTREVAYPPKLSTEGLVYEGVGEGGRNDAMAKYAGSVHAKLHPSLWPTIGWQMFESANQKNNPPLNPRELRITWESIERAESRANPSGRVFQRAERTWGPAEPEKKEPDAESKNIPAGALDPQESIHVSEVAASQIIDSDNTYPLDMPPFDEALLGGVSLGELIVVAGQSGHGKTTLIQDWSVTLASGGQTKRPQLPVLWFSYEVLARPMWQKFQTMGANEQTPIYMPRVTETGDLDWVTETIEKAIAKWGVKIIAIDHLGFLRSPKGNYSNAAEAITQTVRALKRLAVKHGLIIMLPVHVRKTASRVPDLNDIRDSLGIAQEADTVFFIGREKDGSGMPTVKAKVWLMKNRKTGMAVNAMFDFQFGRYYYSPQGTKEAAEEEEFNQREKEFNDKLFK